MPTATRTDCDDSTPRPADAPFLPRPDVTDDTGTFDLADLWLDLGGGG